MTDASAAAAVLDFTSIPEHGVRVYRTGVSIRGLKTATHVFAGYPYRLAVEERCACG